MHNRFAGSSAESASTFYPASNPGDVMPTLDQSAVSGGAGVVGSYVPPAYPPFVSSYGLPSESDYGSELTVYSQHLYDMCIKVSIKALVR